LIRRQTLPRCREEGEEPMKKAKKAAPKKKAKKK
jgi:hypothetical protein